jgi:glutamine amidotransferase
MNAGGVAIVDIGIGNLRSVQKAVERAAADSGRAATEVVITDDPDRVARADRVVLPGQGAFRLCSLALARDLGDAVRGQIQRGTPYLGICLGLQALFTASEEAPSYPGLGVYEGTNVRLRDGARDAESGVPVKIPHMGWNALRLRGGGHPLLEAAGGEGTHVYFVHSFHAAPEDRSLVVATVQHGPHEVTAAVARDNVFATQFHPEKSQTAGLALLGAFLSI